MKSYLALGDSYTIGEGVLLSESYPYQTVQLLRKQNIQINAPEIIAKTGWTTDELQEAIDKNIFLSNYDIVTLLIGVNNQYRRRSLDEYEIQFEKLLQQAISFTINKKVFVLSIPDWGLTPFAKDRDIQKIAEEIDAYNNACKKITEHYQCVFIDNTFSQRADSNNEEMLASDGLHPSGKEYAKWAKILTEKIATLHF